MSDRAEREDFENRRAAEAADALRQATAEALGRTWGGSFAELQDAADLARLRTLAAHLEAVTEEEIARVMARAVRGADDWGTMTAGQRKRWLAGAADALALLGKEAKR